MTTARVVGVGCDELRQLRLIQRVERHRGQLVRGGLARECQIAAPLHGVHALVRRAVVVRVHECAVTGDEQRLRFLHHEVLVDRLALLVGQEVAAESVGHQLRAPSGLRAGERRGEETLLELDVVTVFVRQDQPGRDAAKPERDIRIHNPVTHDDAVAHAEPVLRQLVRVRVGERVEREERLVTHLQRRIGGQQNRVELGKRVSSLSRDPEQGLCRARHEVVIGERRRAMRGDQRNASAVDVPEAAQIAHRSSQFVRVGTGDAEVGALGLVAEHQGDHERYVEAARLHKPHEVGDVQLRELLVDPGIERRGAALVLPRIDDAFAESAPQVGVRAPERRPRRQCEPGGQFGRERQRFRSRRGRQLRRGEVGPEAGPQICRRAGRRSRGLPRGGSPGARGCDDGRGQRDRAGGGDSRRATGQ